MFCKDQTGTTILPTTGQTSTFVTSGRKKNYRKQKNLLIYLFYSYNFCDKDTIL